MLPSACNFVVISEQIPNRPTVRTEDVFGEMPEAAPVASKGGVPPLSLSSVLPPPLPAQRYSSIEVYSSSTIVVIFTRFTWFLRVQAAKSRPLKERFAGRKLVVVSYNLPIVLRKER